MMAATGINVQAVSSNVIVIVAAISAVLVFFGRYVGKPLRNKLDQIDDNTRQTKEIAEAMPTLEDWRISVDQWRAITDLYIVDFKHRLEALEKSK